MALLQSDRDECDGTRAHTGHQVNALDLQAGPGILPGGLVKSRLALLIPARPSHDGPFHLNGITFLASSPIRKAALIPIAFTVSGRRENDVGLWRHFIGFINSAHPWPVVGPRFGRSIL